MTTDLSPFPDLGPGVALAGVAPGQVLGRYELLFPVAKGGMAMVWAARLKGTRGFQKMVAIKTMLPAMVDEPKFEKMFLDEASLASSVRHPNVVEILDLGEQHHVLYLVMEWVDGEPLNVITRYAEPRGGVPLPIAVHLVRQVCRGLHAAHELRDEEGTLVGLVHRDISPQNILVTYSGVVKIVDFGVARATAGATGETERGSLRGKIAYMAPEQVRGETIDRRTDVFALGILLYLLTTGRHPLRGEDHAVTMRNISSSTPVEAPSSVAPGYPSALEAVVLKALEKNPASRFATANDMERALSEALQGSVEATDEDVRNFMLELLPDRLDRRRRAIREALRSADQTSDPPPSGSSSREDQGAESASPSAAFHDFLSSPRSSSIPPPPALPSGLREEDPTEVTGEAAATHVPSRLKAIVIAALALGVGALLVVWFGASGEPSPRAPPADRRSPAAFGDSDDHPAGAALSDAGGFRAADAAFPADSSRTSAPPSKPARSKAPKSSEDPARGFVSPIRDPGF